MVKTSSLKGSINFRKTLKKGKYTKSKTIGIYFLPTKKTDRNYLGICVSKKNGNSVIRNRLKRWVKETYKEAEPTLKTGYNIVVLFKKEIVGKEVSFSQLNQEIRLLLEEIRL